MQKHFLVTVSNDVEHLYGVRFMRSFFTKMSDHLVTLLHVCRLDCNDMNKTLMEMWASPDERVHGQLTIGARRAIDKSIELLSESKMAVDRMITKTVAERYGKVKDILTEGQKGLYDAIVLGRRAGYTFQWVFERPADEIAQAMIKDNEFKLPLWICPELEEDRKNVLVCLDGSENSLRTVDHVGYILSDQHQHTITLFYVEVGTVGDVSVLFEQAKQVLSEHNIADHRIHTRTVWGMTVPGTILSEVESGKYAAVAVGLHGQGQNLLKSVNLAGSTPSKLIGKIENAALWCCP